MPGAPKRSLNRVARILIVDDHPMMRDGLTAQISTQPDLEVCGEAEDVADALLLVRSTSPDLAIIDVSLKKGHGLELIKQIKARFPAVKMLVLSAYHESLFGERALRAGANGYLNKQETRQKLFQAIRAILAGELYISPELTQRLVGRAVGHKSGGAVNAGLADPVEVLSDRELEVFQLIGQGITTSAIAKRLHLSPHTVDTHREKIKAKLNLKNSAELQREATQWVLENN